MNTTELKALADREVELIEKAAQRAGMVSLLNHGAASCVYSEGCAGVTQEHLMAFAREIALHCATALYHPTIEDAQGEIRALRATEQALRERVKALEDALLTAHDHIDMWALEISHCKDAERIRSALPALLEDKT